MARITITINEGLPPVRVNWTSWVLKHDPKHRTTLHDNNRNFYKALRNMSGGYIAKKQVRDFVFKKDGNKCKICGNADNLTVDHIVSVYACSIGEIPISELNSASNLQTLCGSCNSGKIC